MRLEKAIFHNIGPFDHAEIDLESLGADAKLVALCGVNGAGKTFSLQAAIAGAAYRKMPTQGTLVARAKSRESYVEATLVNGQRWTVHHDLDAVSRKGEAWVKDASGVEAYKGTSVKLFDAWSAKHFTAQDVLFATSFAVQKSGGFVDLGSADRISVILQVVGVSRIERMAEVARKEASAARVAFEKIEARLKDERARGGDVVALEAALVEATELAATWDSQVTMDRERLEAARVEVARLAELGKEAEAARARRAELEARIAAETEKVTDLTKRVAACRTIIADAGAIRGAARQLVTLDADLARLSTEAAERQGELTTAEAELSAAREQLASARREKRAAEERAAKLTERLGGEAAVSRAVALLPDCRTRAEAARAELARLEDERQTLVDRRQVGSDERITCLRRGLTMVSELGEDDDASGAIAIAQEHLESDDETTRSAAEAPKLLAAAFKAHIDAKAVSAALDKELSELERLAARAAEFETARDELVEAKAVIFEASERETQADQRVTAAHAACEPLRTAAAPLLARAEQLRVDREILASLAGKAELLTKAEALVTEREKQLAAAQAEVDRLCALLSATPEPVTPSPAPDVAALTRGVSETERLAREKHSAAAVAQQRLTAAQEAQGRLIELQAEYDAAADELADWNRLATDFGRDGLQSAEVDSAGPELTALTNDLLHSCHGPQFTVSIETSRLASNGKSEVEECRVQVIDSVAGREGEAREFSGGQSVIIGEAISLALTMLACNRAGLKGITLVRDESGAALDPVAGRAYVKMLRRAAEFVNASRVLLVTHSKECAEMCDARILIQNGTISYQ